MGENAVFRHFFGVVALAGGLAEWGLVCWVMAGLDVHAQPAVHLLAPLVLAAANRLAANGLEAPPSRWWGPLPSQVVLACAFGAAACLLSLGATAGAWTMLRLLGGFPAEAGLVAGSAREAFFGPAFRVAGSLAMSVVGLVVAYGYLHGYRRLVVTRMTVPVPGLPPALAGLRLVHVSDLHLGPLADRGALREALARVARLAPDVVCLTGDIVDSPLADLTSWLPELTALGAPLGVFAILGNHDRYAGADRVAEALARFTRCRLLRDEVATITRDGARLHLVGLEDRPVEEGLAVLPSLIARVPAGEPLLLLAHHPKLFEAAVDAGVPLMLAGHTHGGQVAVPGMRELNPARLLMTRFATGTHERDGAVLHVNRGLGTSGQRVRIGAPREITVITLVEAAARAA